MTKSLVFLSIGETNERNVHLSNNKRLMYEKAVHQLLAPYISLYPDMGNGKFNNSLTSFNANGKNIHEIWQCCN